MSIYDKYQYDKNVGEWIGPGGSVRKDGRDYDGFCDASMTSRTFQTWEEAVLFAAGLGVEEAETDETIWDIRLIVPENA